MQNLENFPSCLVQHNSARELINGLIISFMIILSPKSGFLSSQSIMYATPKELGPLFGHKNSTCCIRNIDRHYLLPVSIETWPRNRCGY